MLSCQKLWFLMVMVVVLLKNHQSWAKPVAEAAAEPNAEAGAKELSKLLLITDDVILDKVEKDNKKVIRVNPLDLPTIKEDPNISNIDSSLYKIQSLKPYSGKRKYTNMRRSKPQNENDIEPQATLNDTPIIRGFSLLANPEKPLKPKHQPKKKQLHFLYNQEDLAGNLLSKTMRVHVAPGAYPVYYVVSKTNGRFGKYPLKSFDTPQAFRKYLKKNKLEDLPMLETYEEVV
ncbi:uncharacterized protein LOC135961593 [Calliphora vicina]|uniref:uncharacterized protein LOC135961593 n=1 Tax=Calliphora vicina TaxID=7373 RepID=UPI00325B0137